MRRSTSSISTVLILGTVAYLPSLPVLAQQGPEDIGAWGELIEWNFTALHVILLKSEKLLCIDVGAKYAVYDLSAGTFTTIDGPNEPGTNPPETLDLHCSGHAQSADGSVVFVGGSPEGGYDFAFEHTVMFDPDAYEEECASASECSTFNNRCTIVTDGRSYCDPWKEMDKMPDISLGVPGKRWYPTCTTLGDGRIMVLGGDKDDDPDDPLYVHTADIPLIFDPTKFDNLQYAQLPGADLHLPYYPFNFLLSTGKVFYGGFDTDNEGEPTNSLLSRTLDLTELGQWNDGPTNPVVNGPMAMIGPDLIMRAGGFQEGTLMSSTAFTINPTSATPLWTAIAPMPEGRSRFFLVPLPDGNVLAVTGYSNAALGGELQPFLYSPDPAPLGEWSVMAPMAVARKYHSTALLLPDARVLVAGGVQPAPKNAQIFSPPYFFTGYCLKGGSACSTGAQPTITAAPDVVYYQSEFELASPYGQYIDKVTFIRLGAPTHTFDQNQRFMELTYRVDPSDSNKLLIDAPAAPNDAPPGYYMLFIVEDPVPSDAKIIKLEKQKLKIAS